jgi:hypothetical protein
MALFGTITASASSTGTFFANQANAVKTWGLGEFEKMKKGDKKTIGIALASVALLGLVAAYGMGIWKKIDKEIANMQKEEDAIFEMVDPSVLPPQLNWLKSMTDSREIRQALLSKASGVRANIFVSPNGSLRSAEDIKKAIRVYGVSLKRLSSSRRSSKRLSSSRKAETPKRPRRR